ncbi:MAG: hypothetical protein H6683_02530 [Deltaproteobacteria bacterium]|nr:hypothetical protein [Deltaproteobacteria bacterium]
MTSTRFLLLVLLALSLPALFAACGGDDDDDNASVSDVDDDDSSDDDADDDTDGADVDDDDDDSVDDDDDTTDDDDTVDDDDTGDDDDTAPAVEYWDVIEAPETDDPEIYESIELNWLEERSLYRDYAAAGQERKRSNLGDFGMGNGRVFALMGLNMPFNTLTEYTGPFYQDKGGKFGDTPLLLHVGNDEIEFGDQWIWRVRKTPMMLTKAVSTDKTLALHTLDYVPRDFDAIIRVVTVQNLTNAPIADVSITTKPVYDDEESPQVVDNHLIQVRGLDSKTVYIGALDDDEPHDVTVNEDDGVRLSWSSLGANVEKTVVIYLWFVRNGDDTTVDDFLAEFTEDSLDDTRKWWSEYLDQGAKLRTPDPKVNDLYEGLQITIANQIDEGSRAVSVMSRYTRAWLRDTYGALTFYLSVGRIEEAKAMLDYIYKYGLKYRTIRNSMPLDEDLGDVTEPENPAEFWSGADFMPGRNKAEAPGYLPLIYAKYYAATGDPALIEQRYEYLKAALTLQDRSPENLITFSGDETFRYPLMVTIPTLKEPHEDYYSANSSLLFVAGAEAMRTLADAVDDAEEVAFWDDLSAEMRQATDDYYWDGDHYAIMADRETLAPWPAPFEDVSTKPVYLDYLAWDDPNAATHVEHYMDQLLLEDGTLLSNRYLGQEKRSIVYDGMVPGLFLDNVAKLDHPSAEAAFNALDITATPSGNYAEVHKADHDIFSLTHAPSGRGAEEVTSRYRPWEGGDNGAALMQYLVGEQLDVNAGKLVVSPHLPNNWPWLDAFDLPAGANEKFDLRLDREGNEYTLTLSTEDDVDLDVEWRVGQDGDWDVDVLEGDGLTVDRVIRRFDRTTAVLTGVTLNDAAPLTLTIAFEPRETK